jgi:hypothetical protein
MLMGVSEPFMTEDIFWRIVTVKEHGKKIGSDHAWCRTV